MRHQALLFFVYIIYSASTTSIHTAHAVELNNCIEKVFSNEPSAYSYLQELSRKQRAITSDFRSSLEIGLVQTEATLRPWLLKIHNNTVTYNNKKVTFKKIDRSNRKTNKKVSFIAHWTFSLKKAQEVSIFEHQPSSFYQYKYLSINGQKLQRNKKGFWVNLGKGSLSVTGKKGGNHVVAICGIANTTRSNNISICIGPLTETAVEVATKLIDTNKTDEENGWPIYKLGEKYAQQKDLAYGETLADILILHYRSRPKEKEAAKERKRKDTIIGYAISWFDQLHSSERIHFYKKIKKVLPAWVSSGMFLSEKEFRHRSFNLLVNTYAQNSSERKASDTLLPILKSAKKISEKNKRISEHVREALYGGGGTLLQQAGFFQLAMDFLLLHNKQAPRTYRDFKRHIGNVEQRLQAKAQLSGNPEAQQYLAEFETLLQRGADDERAVDSVVSIFRKAGNKLLVHDLSMRSLGVEMLLELSQDNAFYQKVISRAHIQFNKRAKQSLAKGNLKAMNELLASYAHLIDTDPLHKALVNEYMDRCSYNRARYHALHLLESQDAQTALTAAVKLLTIEKALNLSAIEKTAFPSSLNAMDCTIAGKIQKFSELQKAMGAQAQHIQDIQEPGPVIARMALGIPHGTDVNGRVDLKERTPYYSRQVVEPLFNGESVICSTPSYIQALNTQTNSVLWSIDQGPASTPKNMGYTAKQHYAELINGNIAVLWSHPDSHDYTIRAFNKKGNLMWDMSDSPHSQRWTPMCSPYSAFGMLFTIVYDNTVDNQFQVYLAILNGSNGSIEKTIALNTVFATNAFERGIAGLHFTHNAHALYAVSGSGVMFKLSRKSLTIDWANGRIYRPIKPLLTPSSFINIYKHKGNNIVIGHLPSMQEWVAVDSRSGRTLWRSISPNVHYIHSRNNKTMMIASETGNVLSRINLENGRPLWRTKTYGIKITGEGCVVNNIIHLPCENGYARYDANNGRFLSFVSLPQTINKIRVDSHAWYFLSDRDIYICKQGGTFTAQSFNKPSTLYHERIPQRAQALRNVGNLTPFTVLPDFGNPQQQIIAEETSVPHYFILSKNKSANIALLREGHLDQQGVYQPDKILWIESRRNHRIVDNMLITYDSNSFKVRKLPNSELIIEGNVQTLNLINSEIVGVSKKQDTLVIVTQGSRENTSIISMSMETGLELRRSRIKSKDLLLLNGNIAIFKSGKKELTCYSHNRSTRTVLWKIHTDDKLGDRMSARSLTQQHIIIGHGSKTQIINATSGKPESNVFEKNYYDWDASIAKGTLFTGNRTIHIKSGTHDTNVFKTYVAKGIGAVVLYKDKTMKWFDDAGEVELEPLNHSFSYMLERGSNRKSSLKNNTIYLSTQSMIASFDRTTGKIISARTYSGRYLQIDTVLDNSVLMSKSGHTFIMHDTPEKDATLKISDVSNPDKKGWPQDGWTSPQRIGETFWLPANRKDSLHKYAFQFGEDAHNYYLHLYCSPTRTGNSERIFKSTISYGQETEDYFELHWNIDRIPEAIANLSNIDKVQSWKRIDRKGNTHCYLIIDRSHIEKNVRYSPRLNINISEYQKGVLDGTYLFGGLASLKYHSSFGKVSSQQIIPARINADFMHRKKTYDTSSTIIPQGSDLAQWIRSYRVLHGSKKTIAYLKEMAIRCKKSGISVNILACLLNERLKQWSQKNPEVYAVSEQYRTARQDIINELKSFADSIGIDPHNSEYGLTLITVEHYPYTYTPTHGAAFIRSLGTRGSSKNRGDHATRLTRNAPFSYNNTHRPLVAQHFVGSFNVTAPSAITEIILSETPAAIGAVEYISPSKNLTFISKDGTLHNGSKGIADSKNKTHHKKDLSVVTMSHGSKTYTAINYNTRGARRAIKIDELLLPTLKPDEFSRKDLLHALENLPSDSGLGDDIIHKYQPTPQESEKLWAIVVRQTAGNPNNQTATESALDRLIDMYKGNKMASMQASKKLKEIMSTYKVPRSLQRKVFLKYNNSIKDSERWFNLGGIIKVAEKDLTPLPETVDDIFEQTFSYNDKKYNFITSSSEMRKGRWGAHYRLDNINKDEPAIAYHHSSFDLREGKKVFLYFGQAYTGRYGCKLQVWIDGKKVASEIIQHNSINPVMIPLRLKRGKHTILIRIDYQRGWDLTFHIGDISGVPLSIVDYPPTVPLK